MLTPYELEHQRWLDDLRARHYRHERLVINIYRAMTIFLIGAAGCGIYLIWRLL